MDRVIRLQSLRLLIRTCWKFAIRYQLEFNSIDFEPSLGRAASRTSGFLLIKRPLRRTTIISSGIAKTLTQARWIFYHYGPRPGFKPRGASVAAVGKSKPLLEQIKHIHVNTQLNLCRSTLKHSRTSWTNWKHLCKTIRPFDWSGLTVVGANITHDFSAPHRNPYGIALRLFDHFSIPPSPSQRRDCPSTYLQK